MTKLRCIANGDYKYSLEVGQEYVVISDKLAEARGRVRIVDESGESYLFPRSNFVPTQVETPKEPNKRTMGA